MKNIITENSEKTLFGPNQTKEKLETKKSETNLKNNIIGEHNKQTILSFSKPNQKPQTTSEFKRDKWNEIIE